MRLKRRVGRSLIIALFAAASMLLLLALMSTLSVALSRTAVA